MPNFYKLPLIDKVHKTHGGKPSYRCVVEAPRGSTVKFKYDPELQVFVMGKALIKGLTYPFDWGFLPSTLAADGDPLDVMLIHDAASAPGIVIPARLIGVLEVEQREGGERPVRNDRILAVPVKSHREDEIEAVDQLSPRLRKEIEQFFLATAALDDKKLEFHGWHGPARAEERVQQATKRV
jgi:inorganic pyrophosphatase